jgi:hypothetical protein
MAKGNDGNYLQHGVEVSIARILAATDPRGRLHIALTHGMAPYESCGQPPDGQAKRLLHDALSAAQRPPGANEPTIGLPGNRSLN